jgi:serine/threonine protein kinase
MTQATKCPTCGCDLPPLASAGVCPKCLLAAGLASSPAIGTQPTVERPSPRHRGFEPPSPAELAQRFPQLDVLELLGKGGMGAVYKARQRQLDRLVAVKVLPPEVVEDSAFAERFTREARALARLNHPNIVGIFDFGRSGDLYYFVMEYVDGANLREALRDGKLAPAEALAIVSQICDALQYAHDEGIVHRDIKPENILLDRRGRVKIADFGLAKLLGHEQADLSLTGTHQVMGTLRYMAPEQMEGSHSVDHRADIYSLGVVFYELLTGEVPAGRFAPPSKKVQVDVRLDEVVLRALEREPDHRYQHASEVKTELSSLSSPAAAALPKPVAAGLSQRREELPPGSSQWRAIWDGLSEGQQQVVVMALWLVVIFCAIQFFTFDIDKTKPSPASSERWALELGVWPWLTYERMRGQSSSLFVHIFSPSLWLGAFGLAAYTLLKRLRPQQDERERATFAQRLLWIGSVFHPSGWRLHERWAGLGPRGRQGVLTALKIVMLLCAFCFFLPSGQGRGGPPDKTTTEITMHLGAWPWLTYNYHSKADGFHQSFHIHWFSPSLWLGLLGAVVWDVWLRLRRLERAGQHPAGPPAKPEPGRLAREPVMAPPPGVDGGRRPWLFGVHFIAVMNLLSALLLMFALAGDTETWIPPSAHHGWWSSEQTSVVLSYAICATSFVASVGLFLWKPWARTLTLGTCWASLVVWTIDVSYMARYYIPRMYSELVHAFRQQEPLVDEAELGAGLFVFAVITAFVLITLGWLIAQAIYLQRPVVVWAFEGQRPLTDGERKCVDRLNWLPAVFVVWMAIGVFTLYFTLGDRSLTDWVPPATSIEVSNEPSA